MTSVWSGRLSIGTSRVATGLMGLLGVTLVATAALAQATSAEQTDEAEMLARARAERSADGRSWGDIIRDRAIEAEAARRVEEAERDAELDEITARLARRAPIPHPAQVAPPLEDPTPAASAPPGAIAEHTPLPPGSIGNVPTRATILLVMTPGDRGIRRMNPTADPIVCLAGGCWVSRGLQSDARTMRQGKAFGPVNTLINRAGACNDSTRCVFRNVEMAGPAAVIQPVDLRLLRHDRREPIEAAIDFGCRIVGRALDCGPPLQGADYVMWVVPEAVVVAAGPEVLERFMQQGALRVSSRLAGEPRPR